MTGSKLAEAGDIRVVKRLRFGSVPEDLLEDKRLSMDARLVAAWLEIKPDGWIVKIGHLRWALGIPGDTRWARIAKELEKAGYLNRRRAQGEGGRWGWAHTFVSFQFAEPTTAELGLSGFGPTESGLAEVGEPQDEVVPEATVPIVKNTTTTTTTTSAVTTSAERIHWPTTIKEVERRELDQVLDAAPDDHALRQALVNELARKLELREIRVGSVPYLRELVKRAKKGRFQPNAGVTITARQQAIRTSVSPAESTQHEPPVETRAAVDTRQAIAEMNRFIQKSKSDTYLNEP